MVSITIKGLKFGYNGSNILDDLDLLIEDSEVLGLVGPNGSGKTTLIKCIDRILKPKGSILLDGKDLESIGRKEIARRLGYVPSPALHHWQPRSLIPCLWAEGRKSAGASRTTISRRYRTHWSNSTCRAWP